MSGPRISEAEAPAETHIAPRDVSFRSGTHTLRGRKWPARTSTARGTLVIAHGLFEHALCYRDLAEYLAQELDLDVVAFDFRGHGRSDGRRGVVRSFSELESDLLAALDFARDENSGLPLFLFAHSNGGLVALRTIRDEGRGVAGMVLSNPAIKLAAHVPKWKLLVAGLLKHVPNVTLNAGLPTEGLNFHPDYLAERLDDPLLHSRINARLYFGMRDAGAEVITAPSRIQIPLLYLVGGRDGVIDAQANLSYYNEIASPDKSLRYYPDLMHEPVHEYGFEAVRADVREWIKERMGQG